jgi:hypothetical protein
MKTFIVGIILIAIIAFLTWTSIKINQAGK